MINKKLGKTFFLSIFFTLLIISISAIAASSQPTAIKDKKEATQQVKRVFNKDQANQPEIKPVSNVKKEKNPYADAEISIKLISSAKNTFGYDILIDGRPFIHQPHIPCIPGNEGFTSKEKAQKVAEFVVKKIRKNEVPPTVTMNDLQAMNVLK